MTGVEPLAYVDASVLIASSGREAHSEWALSVLWGKALVSSAIVRVELARFAHRMGYGAEDLSELESRVSFLSIDDRVIEAAVAVSGEAKALDALHVGTWARMQSLGLNCSFITADRKQAAAALSVGATVVHPYGGDLL